MDVQEIILNKLTALENKSNENGENIAVLLDRSNNDRKNTFIGAGLVSAIVTSLGTILVKYLELYK